MREIYGYYERASLTPVIDAIRTIVGVASVVIGGHAVLFGILAWRDGRTSSVVANTLILVAIVVANLALDALRYWRRHRA
jgi:hypothetical protein